MGDICTIMVTSLGLSDIASSMSIHVYGHDSRPDSLGPNRAAHASSLYDWLCLQLRNNGAIHWASTIDKATVALSHRIDSVRWE
jgi:hypothetical protein